MIYKTLIIIASLTISISTAIAQEQGFNEKKKIVRFVIFSKNISSWSEFEHGLSIKLTDKAKHELSTLTHRNVGNTLQFYVEHFLVSSPIIRTPIKSGSVILAVTGETKEKILSLLPKDTLKNKAKRNSSANLDTSRRIQLVCGGTRAEIICGYNHHDKKTDDRVCSNNTLVFTMKDGQVVFPQHSALFEKNTTAVQLSCTKFLDGEFYIPVGYLSGSYNCPNCRQLDVYTVSGERAYEHQSVFEFLKNNSTAAWNTMSIEERKTVY